MDDLAKQSASAYDFSVTVRGTKMDLISQCSSNMEELLKDVRQLVITFEDVQNKGMKKIFQRFRNFINRTGTAFHLIYIEDHIKALIKAAKYIQSSQHVALTTILLICNQVK